MRQASNGRLPGRRRLMHYDRMLPDRQLDLFGVGGVSAPVSVAARSPVVASELDDPALIAEAGSLLAHFHASEPFLAPLGDGPVDHSRFAAELTAAGY